MITTEGPVAARPNCSLQVVDPREQAWRVADQAAIWVAAEFPTLEIRFADAEIHPQGNSRNVRKLCLKQPLLAIIYAQIYVTCKTDSGIVETI